MAVCEAEEAEAWSTSKKSDASAPTTTNAVDDELRNQDVHSSVTKETRDEVSATNNVGDNMNESAAPQVQVKQLSTQMKVVIEGLPMDERKAWLVAAASIEQLDEKRKNEATRHRNRKGKEKVMGTEKVGKTESQTDSTASVSEDVFSGELSESSTSEEEWIEVKHKKRTRSVSPPPFPDEPPVCRLVIVEGDSDQLLQGSEYTTNKKNAINRQLDG